MIRNLDHEILTLRWASAANPDFVARLAAIVVVLKVYEHDL